MALLRNFKTPSFHGKTITQVYNDSGGLLKFFLDNAEVGLTDKQTLGLSEADMITLMGLMGLDASYNDNYQFESNIDTTDTKRYEGNTTFNTSDFSLTEIDSIVYETRTAAATTYTTRASLAALNTYSQSVGAPFYLRITATYDAAYEGFATVNLNWNT
jgi:hypothetical protein